MYERNIAKEIRMEFVKQKLIAHDEKVRQEQEMIRDMTAVPRDDESTES